MSEPTSIVVITEAAMVSARKIARSLPGAQIYGYAKRVEGADVEFEEVAVVLRDLFRHSHRIIAIMSAGIVVRTLGQEVHDKLNEPPVLVISEDGQSIIPLLGGHHGGNELARQLAGTLQGHAALTTTGDTRLGVALDAPPKGWRLANPQHSKTFTANLLAGQAVELHGKLEWLSTKALHSKDSGTLRITETVSDLKGTPEHLVYHPARLALGVGCERDTTPEELSQLVGETIRQASLSKASIAGVFSLDLKSDEAAVHAIARELGVPARFFDAPTLESQTPRLANPSDVVFREVGCHGVAEAAALEAAGSISQLVVSKQKSRRATCAIAESRELLDANTIGRARGRLAVVGLGPGRPDWRSQIAHRVLAEAEDLVGYEGYLDLIDVVNSSQNRHAYRLGEETLRVQQSLNLAATGRYVALVCSGDPGVYAMAALVYELLDTASQIDWERVEVEVLPGISAMQSAAAAVGAPLGHDFCAISLSDLLTPWQAIEKRVTAAAEGDFVVAFYNPRSRARSQQLERAVAILRTHRPTDTPVVVARNLGRPGEEVNISPLHSFDCATVDMMSIVLVGASTTKKMVHGNQEHVYTPRGYAAKTSTEVA